MIFLIVTGILMLAITAIVSVIVDNASRQVDNALYQLIGKTYQDTIQTCQRNSNSLDRENCLAAANNTHNSTLLIVALPVGIPAGFAIALLLRALNILDS